MSFLAVAIPHSRSSLYALLGDDTRLKVLALCDREELTVGELATLLHDTQPQMSRRVSALREHNLVTTRRDGNRVLVSANKENNDVLVNDAIQEGTRLTQKDGSFFRIARIVSQREHPSEQHFESAQPTTTATPLPEHLGHLSALAPLIEKRALAIDIGTGDGLSLDALAPLFQKVIAVERSPAQQAKLAERIGTRNFHNVSLFAASYDDTSLIERVDKLGGADVIYVARMLHHVAKPSSAFTAFSRLLKPTGKLLILDYLRHDDENLRVNAGDVWLGFDAEKLENELAQAGFSFDSGFTILPEFHPTGHDAHLTWHCWVATKSSSLNAAKQKGT